MKATLVYSLARLGVFAVAFALLAITPLPIWGAVVLAALIGLLISYIFFGRLREKVALSIVQRRQAPERDVDADLEDGVLDATTGPDARGGTARQQPASLRKQPPAEDD